LWGNGWWHERGEDVAAIAVLVLVLAIAIAIALTSIQDLSLPGPEPPAPSVMLLSLLGLAANLATAYLFADPARQRWSFRAALAHELADGSLTVVGLVGAVAIKLFAWRWVDPGLSLTIAVWLGAWASRLLARRAPSGAAPGRRTINPGTCPPPAPPQGAHACPSPMRSALSAA
jgi:Co/Zn/Cd efflux system component